MHGCAKHIPYLDDLEQETEGKGGIEQLLAAHFANVYKLAWPSATSLRIA
jgi:hypothetical protein